MSDIRLVREYPQSPAKVWRALTDPALMALWMMEARPEGFSPTVGTRFKFVGKPQMGWRGFVECDVLEAREPSVSEGKAGGRAAPPLGRTGTIAFWARINES
jgi:uncharacterized protein YndB with AHSA1/START domain